MLAPDARLIADRAAARRSARAALAARALLQAGDHHTAGRRGDALRAVAFAGRVAPTAIGGGSLALMLAIARGDDYGCYRQTRRLLAVLAERVGSHALRHSGSSGASASDPDYDADDGARRAAKLRRRDAGAAPWSRPSPSGIPPCCWLSGRAGVQFPDRRLMPDGYPRDDAEAIAHLGGAAARAVSPTSSSPPPPAGGSSYYPAFAEHLRGRHRLLRRRRRLRGVRAGMSGRIVIAGCIAQKPYQAGHTWQFLQYLLGFRRLG